MTVPRRDAVPILPTTTARIANSAAIRKNRSEERVKDLRKMLDT